MARLIHLNGAPGVGKSTIAQRYADAHPGVLNCDVDRLRCLVGGWRERFAATGAIIRPVALAMIRAHLELDRDVVLPQMLADETERSRFRAAAVESGHDYLHLHLRASPGRASDRFHARSPSDPLHAVIGELVDDEGGPSVIEDWERRLARAQPEDVIHLDADGDVDDTLARLESAIDSAIDPAIDSAG